VYALAGDVLLSNTEHSDILGDEVDVGVKVGVFVTVGVVVGVTKQSLILIQVEPSVAITALAGHIPTTSMSLFFTHK
jgi:hypothetical protein